MTLSPYYVFSQNLYPVTSVTFFSAFDADYLITGDEKGIVKFWSLLNYKQLLVFEAHCTKITSIHADDDTRQLVTQVRGEIKIWNCAESPLNLQLIRVYSSSMTCLSTCSYIGTKLGNYLLACCTVEDSKSISIFHQQSVSPEVFNFKSNAELGMLMVLKFILYNGSNRVLLLTGHESGVLKCHQITFDDETGLIKTREMDSLKLLDDMITSLDFDETTCKGVCGSVDTKMTVFRLKDSDKNDKSFSLSFHKSVDITNPGISGIVIRPDFRLVAVSGWDSRVRLFSWKTMKLLVVIDHHNHPINSVSFSRELISTKKKLLAISSSDKAISLWSPYSDIHRV